MVQVFISDQMLYSKADLEKHMRTGDDAGPLAESGFKGHPLCRFCRQRFYDGDELYKHMEGRHEHCFICRKRDPQKFIYYKDYSELEGERHSSRHSSTGPAWSSSTGSSRGQHRLRHIGGIEISMEGHGRSISCTTAAVCLDTRSLPVGVHANVSSSLPIQRALLLLLACTAEHFQSQHHPCPHPACLERKFVVFAEEPELKRHFATEHGSEMNMSRAQRRNLLSVNIQLNYSREQEEAQAAAALQRPGIVIGGGHNLPRRGGMRHSRSDGAMAAALQASIETSQVETAMRQSAADSAPPSSVTFSAEDFPSVSGQGSSGVAPLGTWVGSAGEGVVYGRGVARATLIFG